MTEKEFYSYFGIHQLEPEPLSGYNQKLFAFLVGLRAEERRKRLDDLKQRLMRFRPPTKKLIPKTRDKILIGIDRDWLSGGCEVY